MTPQNWYAGTATTDKPVGAVHIGADKGSSTTYLKPGFSGIVAVKLGSAPGTVKEGTDLVLMGDGRVKALPDGCRHLHGGGHGGGNRRRRPAGQGGAAAPGPGYGGRRLLIAGSFINGLTHTLEHQLCIKMQTHSTKP